MLTSNVFGVCDECKRRLDTENLIVESKPLTGDKFYCNRCRPRKLISLYPSGFDKTNIWMLLLEE